MANGLGLFIYVDGPQSNEPLDILLNFSVDKLLVEFFTFILFI